MHYDYDLLILTSWYIMMTYSQLLCLNEVPCLFLVIKSHIKVILAYIASSLHPKWLIIKTYLFVTERNHVIDVLLDCISCFVSWSIMLERFILTIFEVLDLNLGLRKIFFIEKLGSWNGSIASASELVVLWEMHVEVLLEDLVSNEPHSADGALKLHSLVNFGDSEEVKSVEK